MIAATRQLHLRDIPTCRQQSKAAPEHEQAQRSPEPDAGCAIPTQALRLQGLLPQAAVMCLSLLSLPQHSFCPCFRIGWIPATGLTSQCMSGEANHITAEVLLHCSHS